MKKIDLQLILRGLAAFWVMYWHFEAAYVTGPMAYFLIPGRTAVWIFFGLSGYVIFYGFESGRYNFNYEALKDFYRNRFLRIYPLFFLCSVSVLIIKYLKHQEIPSLSFNFFTSQFFAIQYSHLYELNGVFWTLGVEMWFYLLAPIFYFGLKRIKNLSTAAGIYIILFLLILVEAFLFKSPDVRTLTSNLTHFFVGFVALKFGPNIYKKANKFTDMQIFCLSFMAFLSTAILMTVDFKLFYTVGSILTDFGIFLILMMQPKFELKRTSSVVIKNLLLLGVLSYGVYVWHAVVVLIFDIDVTKVGFLQTHFAMLVALVMAKIGYDNYEKKFLLLKK